MKSPSILLAILLILGTFVVPLNTHSSYGDGILLFTVHRVAGSGEVNTENLTKERCFVHAQIDIYSAHHGPFHRNNPDKTFYPGDTFDYQTTTWKDDAILIIGSHVPCNQLQTTLHQMVLTV